MQRRSFLGVWIRVRTQFPHEKPFLFVSLLSSLNFFLYQQIFIYSVTNIHKNYSNFKFLSISAKYLSIV